MLTVYLLIAAIYAAGGDAVAAHATLEPPEIPFYQVAHYRVTAEGPAATELVFEAWPEPIPGLRVVAGDPVITLLSADRKTVTQEFTLSPGMARVYTLPEVRLLADGVEAVVLPPRELVVRAPNAEEQRALALPADLYTLADLEAPRPESWLKMALLLVFVTAALFVLWMLLRLLIVFPAKRSTLPPAEEAEAALAIVENDLTLNRIGCEACAVAMSHLLRIYIERRFATVVTVQSTPEFLSETLGDLHLGDAHAKTLRALMQDFDRVKYAQLTPTRDAQWQTLRLVRDVIGAMERHAEQAEAQALRGAA